MQCTAECAPWLVSLCCQINQPQLAPAAAGSARLCAAAQPREQPAGPQVVFNNTATFYYLPQPPPVLINCGNYNSKLGFALAASGQPFIQINNGTGIVINGTYTVMQNVTDTLTNRTGRPGYSQPHAHQHCQLLTE